MVGERVMPFDVHLWRCGAWLPLPRGQLAGFAFWPWMGFRFSIDSNESFAFHAAIEAAGRYLRILAMHLLENEGSHQIPAAGESRNGATEVRQVLIGFGLVSGQVH